MATVKRFEELEVWQRAEVQCRAFYSLVKEGRFNSHLPIRDQMGRSSASVMDNIAEGFDRYSRNDFRNFLVISRGSNADFRSQLYRAHSRNIINDDTFDQLKQASEHLGVKLHHFISYLTGSGFNQKPPSKNFPKGDISEPRHSYEPAPFPDIPDEFINRF
jgi:four helix bundle protein